MMSNKKIIYSILLIYQDSESDLLNVLLNCSIVGDKVSLDFSKESPADLETTKELSFVFNSYQDEPRKVQEYQTLSRKKTMYITQQSFGHSYGK